MRSSVLVKRYFAVFAVSGLLAACNQLDITPNSDNDNVNPSDTTWVNDTTGGGGGENPTDTIGNGGGENPTDTICNGGGGFPSDSTGG